MSGFTIKIVGAVLRTVPGTVCVFLDKQLLSLRPQVRGWVPRMGTRPRPH